MVMIFKAVVLFIFTMTGICLAQEISGTSANFFEDPSFERGPVLRKKYNSGFFMVPRGNPLWDSSGTKAHTGNGALVVSDNDYLIGSMIVKPGTEYQLSAWMRSESRSEPTRLQINWKRASSDPAQQLIKFDLKTPKCPNEYTQYKLVAIAPDDAVEAMIFISGPKDKTIWVDDVYFGESLGAQ